MLSPTITTKSKVFKDLKSLALVKGIYAPIFWIMTEKNFIIYPIIPIRTIPIPVTLEVSEYSFFPGFLASFSTLVYSEIQLLALSFFL